MTESEVLAEVQALHDMIRANYRVHRYCVLVDSKGADKGRMAGLQILLGQLLRLDTLVAVLPILQPNGKPIDFDSTSRLWLGELLALRDWVEGKDLAVLEVIKEDHRQWAPELRNALGYIKQPIRLRREEHATEEPEMAYWPEGPAHARKPFQGALPF